MAGGELGVPDNNGRSAAPACARCSKPDKEDIEGDSVATEVGIR